MTTSLMTQQTPENIHQTALASLEQGQQLINKSYLANLEQYNVQLLSGFPEEKINAPADVRIFAVERIVLENKQSALESLTSAYTALGTAGYSVFLLLKSNGIQTDVYLGTRGQAKRYAGNEAGNLLEQAFNGHFSGSHFNKLKGEEIEKLLYGLRQSQSGERDIQPAITAVTGVPSLALEEREHFMQGLEHFIDAAEGQIYQALILADPITPKQLEFIQTGYEGVSSQLYPLLKQSISFGKNESDSVGLSLSESISQSLGTSLSLTETKGTSESSSFTTTSGTSESKTLGSSYTESSQSNTSKAVSVATSLGGLALGLAFSSVPVVGMIGAGVGGALGTIFAKTESRGTSESSTSGTSHSTSTGTVKGSSYSTAEGKTTSDTTTTGTTYSHSDTKTLGSSSQITLESVNKSIEQLLKRVDHQLERVDEARRYGGWNSAAYFIGESSASSRALASIFLGLMRGANSNSEDFALTTWKGDKSKQVLPWIANLTHPRINVDFVKGLGISYLTPATLVSGKEMAIQLNLPRRSTSTVAVLETHTFGRQIQNVDGIESQSEKTVRLGKVRHLWKDLPQEVKLDVQKLSSHIFITGSTGSGKSNTVYQLLSELNRNKVKFMVIEPAKGEYKNVFGHRDDVRVFGTNPHKTALLKINPFKFPSDVHVLEHIDRLVEIFNVCWPMYAAMPAVLKDAMLEAYKASGWNLDTSYNRYPELFPSFADLLTQLKNVIDNSAFSQEVRSNYEGSLVTRVKSLTNGLNGQIFSSDEIDNGILFDENVIVDLSRVGSQETKALIMGILVMRLNEYRMSETDGMNQPLKHVTVLEEAHNILKRTSTEQSSEGSNVAGKAVEMLSNSIAEMRTYGEGFIIADQSPSAVDISAIRNTNTKIVMRLPDEQDRLLAGKSSGLNDEQLQEIARLPKGVAVVYQNDWLEPVLCKIHKFDSDEKPFIEIMPNFNLNQDNQFKVHLAELLFNQKVNRNKTPDLNAIKRNVEKSSLPVEYKKYCFDIINHLQQGITPEVLNKPEDYLIDLYQRMINQELYQAMPELSVEWQQHFSKLM